MPLGAAVFLLLAIHVPAQGAEPQAVLYHGPLRFKNEADHVKTMKYRDKAEAIEGLSGWDILRDIERRGRAGNTIAAIEIFGHGLPSGPYTTGADAMRNPDDRLTIEKIKAWALELRAAGVEPRNFFAPGATITIRACYVGAGEIPKVLLDILPKDGKVLSDYGYYMNTAASNLIGGAWSRQRVTTKDADFIYKKGSSGETVPWDKRREGRGSGSLVGTWQGEAEVTTVDSKVIDQPTGDKKLTQTIRAGAFVIRELTGGDLELNYMGNILKGTPDGGHCIFSPDAEKGGNMQAADLTLEREVLTGKLIARNKEVYLVRKLTLNRVR
jgi:hypothetical protein